MTATRAKTFNCPVHGHFDLPAECVAIIDTPEFQRLRELKQLGLTYYVYPGASHGRFEHSLGVAHLAGSWAQHLLGSFRSDGNLHREDRHSVRALELAALCHDLGHGPFSHVFENELLPRVLGESAAATWHHEDMSERILDHCVDANSLDLGPGFSGRKELGLVKDLMRGSLAQDGPDDASPGAPGGTGMFGSQGAGGGGGHGGPALLPKDPEKRWLFDILANKTNGIDCDK
ncbi:SAM domain and HD domain-containing protein 1 [Monoraphidium neglectum]|uniref:SAM domain and HD domain-containing protein 1 n=1 Tax=Monoraphidium neglectum TaxID=145388 RepID=A0A0D2N0G8_9CHLO|nr:SAM domain and HD domain-containing protein 1 [Monoraphidium neglectum]KIY99810.1 SAM domain and HD domain-containing protein 1 [Monoraphidium neglectum]|eukprot:XP_013898830.1 SAM domain and HD domain-containing protein 1 [Monoraphidium neglectum]